MNPSSLRSFLFISYEDRLQPKGDKVPSSNRDDAGGGAGHSVLCDDDRLSSSTGSSLSSFSFSSSPPAPSSRRGRLPWGCSHVAAAGIASGDGDGGGDEWDEGRRGDKDGDRRKKKDEGAKSASDGGGRLSVEAVPGSWKRGSVDVDSVALLLFGLPRSDLLLLPTKRTPRPHEFILVFRPVRASVAVASANAEGVVPVFIEGVGGGCGAGDASAVFGDFLLTRLTGGGR